MLLIVYATKLPRFEGHRRVMCLGGFVRSDTGSLGYAPLISHHLGREVQEIKIRQSKPYDLWIQRTAQ